MTRGKNIVLRTCTGCRRRDAKASLVRVVREGGRAVADPRGRRPGRGAYIHPAPACIEAACRRGGLARALRGSVGRVDLDALLGAVAVAGSPFEPAAEVDTGGGCPAVPYDPRAASARVVKGQ